MITRYPFGCHGRLSRKLLEPVVGKNSSVKHLVVVLVRIGLMRLEHPNDQMLFVNRI
jgi:hypothetical protein